MAQERLVDCVTPLGDSIWFRQMTGSEALSVPFEFDVTFHSKKTGLSAKAMLGKDVTLKVETYSKGVRHFNGICTRFASGGRDGEHLVYTAKLRPWLWIASRNSDCRIFQYKTVPEIVEEVLKPYGTPKNKLTKKYRQWDYCVQYQESDMNFVMRLMEHEGIYFYFAHSAGVHDLMLMDNMSTHSPLAEKPIIKYHGVAAAGEVPEEHFDSWDIREEVHSGAFAADDYDFKHPKGDLKTKKDNLKGHVHDKYERFVWPGGYFEHGEGESYAGVRMEGLQAEYERAQGHTTVRTMAPGYLFTLERCPHADQNRKYLAVAATYFFRDNARMSTGSGAGDATWDITVRSQPTSTPYRPQPLTPKPRAHGPQTAVVVGPTGDEIHTEKYGRVKVQFHWDRYGGKNENSSCFIRVATPIAGGKWGMIQIPRIGNEVIVDFLGGDPDYPIIIGSVYNEVQPVPYELPKYQATSTWKSHSTPGGTTKDYNELRFDDRYGKEQVFIRAQRRMDVRVKKNKYETVQGTSNFLVGGSYLRTCAETNIHTKGGVYDATDKKIGKWSGEAHQIIAASDFQVTAKSGKLELDAPDITIEAKRRITLRVGASTVVLTAGGVQIDGPMIRINSGGSGPSVSSFSFDGPSDAAEADNGEPGYLEYQPHGGRRVGRTRYTGGDVKTDPALAAIAGGINPSNSVVNCGHLVDAAVARLNGSDPNAVSPATGDGTFAEIDARHGTNTQWNQSFDKAFDAVQAGGPGTTALVGIKYNPGPNSHIVTMVNNNGQVAIIEGQDWGGNDPQEIITDPARANERYGANSNVGYAVIPAPAPAPPPAP